MLGPVDEFPKRTPGISSRQLPTRSHQLQPCSWQSFAIRGDTRGMASTFENATFLPAEQDRLTKLPNWLGWKLIPLHST